MHGAKIMDSCVKEYNGTPHLFINGKPHAGCAYITYFTEKNDYRFFGETGFDLFSLPVFFATRTINETTGLPPIQKGIFDGGGFEVFDENMRMLLDAVPNAYVFPRVNVNLPRAWERANPSELCDTKVGEELCACFASEKWAEETERLLTQFIMHAMGSDYFEHIIGFQIAGGNTEEWFPLDMAGSLGVRLREKGGDIYRLMSETVAERIIRLSRLVKKLTDGKLVVGSFYGYTLECPKRETCHHALWRILNDDSVDFLCSPVSYANARALGRDHANMTPIDSLKLHGKLYFAENDTRTDLTVPVNDMPYYNLPVWYGPERNVALETMKLHFARALTHGHAFWWFDMWGGWYKADEYRELIGKLFTISSKALEKDNSSVSRLAVFVDETAYDHISDDSGSMCYTVREALGTSGVPYDIFLINDFDTVAANYDAHIFLMPAETACMHDCIAQDPLPKLIITPDDADITAKEIRDFCENAGITLYTQEDAVIYESRSYVFVHTCADGLNTLKFPFAVREVFGQDTSGALPPRKSFLFEKRQ